jgi:hypothetical protein
MIPQLLAGWRGVLLTAVLSASIVGSAAWQIRGWQAASAIGAANTAQARAEKALADLRAAVANNLADVERVRADEQARALRIAKAQSRYILELQTRLAASERERIAESAKLQEELAHAPTDDTRELGPAALRYLDRVRAEQSAH